MKYLKLFENYNDLKSDIIDIIYELDSDVPIGDFDEEYFEGCPFVAELLLHHQKEFIDEVYWGGNENESWASISIGKFRKIYNEMLVDATKTIISELEHNPNLYSKYGEYIGQLGIDVPDWIVNANKYNL